jgi:hypothetical protein
MAYTLTELSDVIRQRYNAVGDPYFSDDMIRNAIFQAEATLAKEGWLIEDSFSTTSVIGTREYAFPTNTLAVREVRYNNDPLVKIPLKYDPKSGTAEPTGTPNEYGIWDNVIFLFPTPDTALDTIMVRTFVYPQRLTASSALNLPCEYQIDVCDYVLAQFALKDGNIQLHNAYMSAWLAIVDKAIKNKARMLRADRCAVVKDTYFSDDSSVRGYNREYQI